MSDNVDAPTPNEPPAPPLPPTGASEPSEPRSPSSGDSNQTFTGNIHSRGSTNIINEQIIYGLDEGFGTERTFDATDAEALPAEMADELRHTFVADEALVSHLLRQLEQRRILLLTGERDLGKRAMALYLGLQLHARSVAGNAPLFVEALERRVSIDLKNVVTDTKGFGGRATIFVDAFEQRNRALRAFFGTASSLKWRQLADTLRDHGAFLVFTSATHSVSFHENINDHVVHCELSAPSEDVIVNAIERLLSWLEKAGDPQPTRRKAIIEHRQVIATTLRTIPMVTSFIRHFLRTDDDVATALLRFRDASHWFRTTLEHDLEAWSFVLALVLGQPTGEANGVPWADFERLRCLILERLRTDPAFLRKRKKDDDEEIDTRALSQVFSDDVLIERCRAVIGKDVFRLGDVIRFRHPSPLEDLWTTVLTHHRRVLMSLLPVLRNLAESSRDLSLRILAAQIIGRIGELDPSRIALPQLAEWIDADDYTGRMLVGKLSQAAIASGNENYREAMFRYVEFFSDIKALSDSDAARERLLTAIDTYGQIGVYEPTRAMQCLGAIVNEHLVPFLDRCNEVARAAESVRIDDGRTTSRRAALRDRKRRLSDLAKQLFAEFASAHLAVESTVVLLCNIHDCMQILRLMRDWISAGGPRAGVLVGLLFLKDGIADDLQNTSSGVRTLTGVTGNPLLLSLMSGKDSVQKFARFLFEIHESISAPFILPPSLQVDLLQKFWDCMAAWAAQAIAQPDYRESVDELFVRLATMRGRALKDHLAAALESSRFDGTAMRSFADAMTQRLYKPAAPRE